MFILIRVHATSVNPFDCAARSGYLTSYFNYNFPLILGTDASGTIEEVGAGVTNFAPGDSVYARAGVTRDGAYAEYVTVPATDVAAKPKSIDHIHAATLPHVTLTAWQALIEVAKLSEGQTVLIHAAAGGVGHIAVQLSKIRGAKTIGTASVNLDRLQEIQVDETIDYSMAAFEDSVRDVDVVLDLVGRYAAALMGSHAAGGILIATVQPPSEETAAAHGVRQHFVQTTPPIGEVLTEVAALVDSGQLKPHVSAVLPLHEIQKAHEMIEARHTRGKIVLQVVD
ncbi:MAG: NADP-dependent oxidoreductase [Chloroflexota bacterium]|nr:NADP-dependent oxidoreductase [Chloroflexota bacterium]